MTDATITSLESVIDNLAAAEDSQTQFSIIPSIGAMVLIILSVQLECSPDFDKPRHVEALLAKYGVVQKSAISDFDSLVLANICRVRAQEFTNQSLLDPGHKYDGMCRDLARILGLDAINQALMKLAIASAIEQDVVTALDISGELPYGRVVRILAECTQSDRRMVSEVLETPHIIRDNTYHFIHGDQKPSYFIRLPRQIYKLLRRGECSAEDIAGQFFQTSPPAVLRLEDFSSQSKTVEVMQALIKGVMAKPRFGVNILLHGAPGTGKTQFVRALSQHCEGMLVEVATVDSDGDPLAPSRRLQSLAALQGMLTTNSKALVMFDEVEDIFPSCSRHNPFVENSHGGDSDRHKGWLTQLLDENKRPTFWLCNSIRQIEPAYLRRFDLVLEMQGPDKSARTRLIDSQFDGLAISEARKQDLINDEQFSPGHLKKLADVLADLQSVDASKLDDHLAYVISERRKAMLKPVPTTAKRPLRYRTDCVQADTDLIALAEALRGENSARICLFGPPGTGKTDWAHFLGDTIDRPLLVRRGADLLGSYVGETEKRISQAFCDAESKKAVLLIDEADSFLRDRANAHQGWEVSMANQFLTSLESFEGICIVSTNSMERLDPASARRFDFKIKFGWLKPNQCQLLLEELLKSLGIEGDNEEAILRIRKVSTLAPGDFAAVARQNRVLRQLKSSVAVVQALEREIAFKSAEASGRSIGYL